MSEVSLSGIICPGGFVRKKWPREKSADRHAGLQKVSTCSLCDLCHPG